MPAVRDRDQLHRQRRPRTSPGDAVPPNHEHAHDHKPKGPKERELAVAFTVAVLNAGVAGCAFVVFVVRMPETRAAAGRATPASAAA